MKKSLRLILTIILGIILIGLIVLLVLKNTNVSNDEVKKIYKEKTQELNEEIDFDLMAKEIPLLDYVLDYESFVLDKNASRVILNYKLKEDKKLTDIYYDNVKYNSEMIFALVKDLKEVRISVKFINDANEEEIVTYSNFRDENALFDYQDSKSEFNDKYEEIVNKLNKAVE